MAISDSAHSHGRNGLANSCARLRDQTSSRNEIETPRLQRNMTSHSSTAAISIPDARSTVEPLLRRNWVMKPHITICMTGQ